MGTVKNSESAGYDEPPTSEGTLQTADEPETKEAELKDYSLPGEPGKEKLPVEPPLVWDSPPQSGYDAEGALAELKDFFLYGRRAPGPAPAGPKPIPAVQI